MFDTILQATGLILGLIYLYYEYHANPRLWIVGLFMPMISMTVYFRKGLYADFGMSAYYLLMAVYGFLAWTGRIGRRKTELPIRHAGLRVCLVTGVITAAIWVAIAFFLIYVTDSTVPWADAFTTALSIAGTWMLARKYIEQWWIWVAVDAVSTALYIYKGIYPYALLYAIYTIVAILGYYKWRRLMSLSS